MADQSNAAPIAAPAPEQQDQSQETTQEQGQSTQSVPQAPTAKEVQQQLRKLQIKFNGKNEEVSFDPNDDEYLAKQFQLARLGQTKAQEFSTLQREVKSFIDELRKNPAKVLRDPNVGVDIKRLAADIVQEEIENSRKSPEQLAKEKLEAEIKQLKEDREREKNEFTQRELQRLTEQAVVTYDQQISDVIQSSDLPKSPYVVKKMADYLLIGLENNSNLTAKDVYPLVREEILDDIKQMFQVMPEEVIEKVVGKDVFTKIRKKNIAKAKAPTNPLGSIKDTGTSNKPKAASKDKQSFKQYFGV